MTRMQNTSKKTITAYVTAVCDVPESAVDYAIGDDSIGPGEAVEITTSIRAVLSMCGPTKTQPTITVLATVFDDRTYGGEFQWVKGI